MSHPTDNRSMPPGIVIPELAYPDVRAAVKWLCDVFGFRERLQIGTHRAQLVFGGASVVITGPVSLATGTTPDALMVRVPDVERHHAHAATAGARVLNPPTDYPYGERQYTAEDFVGRRWTFSQSIADVDPHEWGGLLIADKSRPE